MDSIRILDLYLFNGVQERSTRHYADDLHSFDEDRGTRDGLNSSAQKSNLDVSNNKKFVIKSMEFNYDEKEGKTKVTIE